MAVFKKEGRSDEVTQDALDIMNDIDGREAISHCWHRVVYDMPVFWVVGRSGAGFYVNERDCV